MKSIKSRIILGSLATVAGIFLTGGSAIAQVANTKHNLGSAGTGPNTFSGTAEICVFCHTPHGASTTAAVPLWNRTLDDPTTYQTYDSLGTSSMQGATAPVGSVSIACLSCHDGTQAMDAVSNQPGSGLVDATFNGGNWGTSPAASTSPIGSITNSVVRLTKDLRDDHPIGVQYGGGGLTVATPNLAAGQHNDPDFNATASEVINGTTIWWVDTGGAGRQKTDIQLYTRTDTQSAAGTGSTSVAIAGGAQPYVECASCHDPHTTNPTFLRISNDGSAVCLACHNK